MILLSALAAGCADPIGHARPDAAGPTMMEDDGGTMPAGKVATTRGSDGTYTTIVDASSQTEWTIADFETGGEVAMTDAWDLRFQRFHISTNGGVTGNGGVEVAPITGMAFAAVTTAPPTGYLSDDEDANGDMVPDYAFEQGDGWYDYDPMTHVLAPKPIVWVVKTNGGTTLKLEILKYYDMAGTSGWFTLHWSPL
ncbi:MAG: hypothetical protein HOV81_24445 [Kofleriaceae bacterium]|nr:hypothetical protein [Kofleriaceae bacterium]